jgi:hypothetical protein
MISLSEYDCTTPPQGECTGELVLSTSTDGGASWTDQIPFQQSVISWDGVVAFSPKGTLYVTGLAGSSGSSIFVGWTDPQGEIDLSTTRSVTPLVGNDKPWITIDPDDGTIYVAYSGPTSGQYLADAILLTQSTDAGKNWTEPVRVSSAVPYTEIEARKALPPFGGQAMSGKEDHLAVAWIWGPGFDTFRTGVWVATSSDGGQTFSPAQQITEAWGVISTAFHDGDYYIFYRHGTEQSQELRVAISSDGGQSWNTSLVSGELPLHFDPDKAPGVNVAPNGIIDVMFYSHAEGAPECIDIAAYRQRREQSWVDQCLYNVYYTFSADGGKSFQSPIKLNDAPVVGTRFLRTRGSSRPGEYMGMASTNEYAYPIWIDTQGTDGTQAYTVQIER